MFLFEKYRPNNVSELMFNQDIMEQLMHIASYDDIPHLIISGPDGGGKKTLLKFFLQSLYDDSINKLNKIKYHITTSASTKKEVDILQSNYHIIIEPTNTNQDKYILQEVIKKYAMHKSFDIFKSKRNFKTIVIYNIEKLSSNSQSALRRTMEIYANKCRFIMVCNNLSKVFDPLRSRCRTFCVALPSPKIINRIITNISIMENIEISDTDKNKITAECNNNLSRAIWGLECIKIKCQGVIALNDVFDKVVELILASTNTKNISKLFDDDLRTHIYNILITNISGSEIISILMDKLNRKIDNSVINAKIIQYASNAEYNLIHGRRDIIHIDYFIAGVIKELQSH